MLLSHRRHRGHARSEIALDRAIGPSFIFRRVLLRGFVQDERVTKPLLGVDAASPRNSVFVVLRGEVTLLADGRTLRADTGDAVFLSSASRHAARIADCEVLEIEWDDGALAESWPSGPARVRLSAGGREVAQTLSERLRAARSSSNELASTIRDVLSAFTAEGARFRPAVADIAATPRGGDQGLMDRIDGVLGRLAEQPMLTDFEDEGVSRRTLTRQIGDLHARYGLLGRGGASWRGHRDVYRLVVASILVSGRDLGRDELARLVGYGSSEALHHAFRRASLPPPTTLRRALLSA